MRDGVYNCGSGRYAARKDHVAREKPSAETTEPATHVSDADIDEAREKCSDPGRREQLEMGRVVFGAASGEEQESALETVGVRHRSSQHATRAKDANRLGHDCFGIAQVLEQLDVGEGKLLLGVRDDGLDPESRGSPERRAIYVKTNDCVPRKEMPAHCARAATEIENTMSGPADCSDEKWDALGNEHEVAALPRGAMMFLVSSAQVLHELTPLSA